MCIDRFAYLEMRIFLRLAERGADLDRARAVAKKVRRAAEAKWEAHGDLSTTDDVVSTASGEPRARVQLDGSWPEL